MTLSTPSFVALQGKIQAYPWGGFDYIRTLLSLPAEPGKPAAEFWLGCHPSAPSTVAGGEAAVADFLQHHGADPLKFLFKVLDVRDMLSIQVHPTADQARQGFERENAAGIALDAKHRNYKDASDKPELMVALCEFWLLHGFKSHNQILTALSHKPFLAPLKLRLEQEGLASAFALALDPNHADVIDMHAQLVDYIRQKVPSDKHAIDYWVHRWLTNNPQTPNGILTLYFFNLVHLQPGQAVYQPPGLPHAYLEGQNIELMANSDNVLRAGLTSKHIDVAELMKICRFEPSDPAQFIIKAQMDDSRQRWFPTPFEAFELSEIDSREAADFEWTTQTPEVIFSLHGSALLRDQSNQQTRVNKGQALLLLPGRHLHLQLDPQERALLYRARNRN